jgi:predicted ATPase
MYGNKSVLNQIRGPGYPELTYLAKNFSSIGLFRMASFGPSEQIRQPQSTDRPDGFVEEDGRNLALVVHRLRDEANLGDFLTEKLKVLIEDLERISTPIRSGTIQIGLHLRGQRDPILAAHLSDGTLRYLSLLAILCDPNPPPLVCIEEPELGMHPDLIRTVGSLLLEASERTQLVVTTHADLLISALGDAPESVLICERGEDGTELHRLDPERMKEWLERYSLGDLWLKGAIGGTRW